jgi:hypothetical protein
MLTIQTLQTLELLPRDYLVSVEAREEIDNFLWFIYLVNGQVNPAPILIIASLNNLIGNMLVEDAIRVVIKINREELDKYFSKKGINYDNYHEFWDEHVARQRSKINQMVKSFDYMNSYNYCTVYSVSKDLDNYWRAFHQARSDESKLIYGLILYRQTIFVENNIQEFKKNRKERKEIYLNVKFKKEFEL